MAKSKSTYVHLLYMLTGFIIFIFSNDIRNIIMLEHKVRKFSKKMNK